jgi:hypothetical protein
MFSNNSTFSGDGDPFLVVNHLVTLFWQQMTRIRPGVLRSG